MPPRALKAIDPRDAIPPRPKIVIFGRGGAGKTFVSIDFPTVYYIDTEDGANRRQYREKLSKAGGRYFGVEQGSQDFDTVLEEIITLATIQHDYRTLVLDSYSKLEAVKVAQMNASLLEAGKSVEFSADKKQAYKYTRRLINWISRLNMNVILICHEKDRWQNEKVIGQTFDGFEKLEYELDLCLRIVKTKDTRTAMVMKTRLEEFPDGSSFPWSYAEFAKRYGQEIVESAAVPIQIATPEMVKKLAILLEIMKVSPDEQDKWLNKANVESFEEMDVTTIGKCISFLEAKIPNLKESIPKEK